LHKASIIFSLSLLLFLPLVLPSTYACEFSEPGLPSPEILGHSAAMFSGTVAEIRGLAIEHAPAQSVIFFEVDRYWKSPNGNDFDKLLVLTPPNQGSCGYEFEEGQAYLVFATNHELHSGALYTSLGYGNKAIDEAREDLVILGEGALPTMQSSWEEQMDSIKFRPIPRDQTKETVNQLLLIIGAGGAIAGIVAFFSIRRSREKRLNVK
jgi:hypothetical protein